MKLTPRRIGIFLLILALSIGFGFAFDGIATALEKGEYPLVEELADGVAENARTFGIPEHILWGFIKTQSDFSSNLVASDQSIGLMQLTKEEYAYITVEILGEEEKDAELLYAPLQNLRAGSAYLSSLFHRYGVWETAIAAYEVGAETVDAWLLDKSLLGEDGTLSSIPDDEARALAKDTLDAAEYYKRLYFAS